MAGSLPIPVVNIGSFLREAGGCSSRTDTGNSSRLAVAEQLFTAFETFGLAYIRVDEVEPEFLAELVMPAMKAVRRFFALPSSEKEAAVAVQSLPGATRGYIGVGAESGSRLFESKEGFSSSFDWETSDASPGNALEAYNIWPSSDGGELKNALSRLYCGMGDVAKAVARALVLVWGSREGSSALVPRLDEMCERGNRISLLRCFHYLSKLNTDADNNREGTTGSSQHTDWGLFTLVAQDEMAGSALQVHYEGQWHDVPPISGTLVINCGDYASLLSEGRLHSPLHRVILTPTERLSFVYFQYPGFESRIPVAMHSRPLSLLQDQSKSGVETGGDPTQLGTDEQSFGEYIVNKWMQVSRV